MKLRTREGKSELTVPLDGRKRRECGETGVREELEERRLLLVLELVGTEDFDSSGRLRAVETFFLASKKGNQAPRATGATGQSGRGRENSQQSVAERASAIPRGGWRGKKNRVGRSSASDRGGSHAGEAQGSTGRPIAQRRAGAAPERRRRRASASSSLERGKNIPEKEDSLQEHEDVGELDDLEVDLLLVVEILRFLEEIAAGLASSRGSDGGRRARVRWCSCRRGRAWASR